MRKRGLVWVVRVSVWVGFELWGSFGIWKIFTGAGDGYLRSSVSGGGRLRA